MDLKGELHFSPRYTFKDIEIALKGNEKSTLIDAFKNRICGFYLEPANELSGFYLFNWDKVPGNDNVKLIEFLTQKFCINWAKTATIEKIENGETIKVSNGKESLSLRLNDETSVTLKIDDNRTYELVVKKEKDKLNIYSGSVFNAFAAGVLCASAIDCLAFVYENCKHDNTSERFPKWVRENINEFNKMYLLFVWEEISGNKDESNKLREFLKQNYDDLDWVDSANIEKIDNGETIKITGSKSLLLKLNKNDKTVSIGKRKKKLYFTERNGKTEICDYFANRFYIEFRNGLVHEGRIKNGAQFSYKYIKLVEMLKGAMVVNPDILLKKISKSFEDYIGRVEKDDIEFKKLTDYLENFDKELEYANSCKGQKI